MHTDQASFESVDNHIRANWHKTVRTATEDVGTLIGLPFPYTVPSIKDSFQEMYYWDTCYTNTGLIAHGLVDLARNNTDNLVYLVNRYGYVPNGNRTYYLTHSQPPHLSMMARDVFEAAGDTAWLARIYPGLKREYEFWMTRRMTPVGLNRYFHSTTEDDLPHMYEYVNKERFPINASTDEERRRWGIHLHAECESGWDFSPRFESRCADCCPVDLNANLYQYETNFAHFSRMLKLGEESMWEERAARRRELMARYLWDAAREFYYDYLYTESRPCRVASAAAFYPLWAGCASQEQAAAMTRRLPLLERLHGIVCCEEGPRSVRYQWDYPNAWAPLQYACVKGLDRYGFHDDARRVAGKFLRLVANNFEATGELWEKYNAVDGTTNAANEYGLPALMGWTAGVFTALPRPSPAADAGA